MNQAYITDIDKPEAQKRITKTPAEIQVDLQNRLAEFELDPEAGFTWDEVKMRMRSGTWHIA